MSNMHTWVSYIAKRKDGTVLNQMLVTCFSHIINDDEIVEVVYYPTNIPYALLSEQSGNPYNKVHSFIPRWVELLNKLFENRAFEQVHTSSGSVCGIKYTRPENCPQSLFKLHLFCMREAFNNPQVGVFISSILLLTIEAGGVNTPAEIWDALVFLSTFNFHNVYGDFVRDHTHSLFHQDGASNATAFNSFDRVLKRTAIYPNSLVSLICKGIGMTPYSSRLPTVAIVGGNSSVVSKQLIPLFKEFRVMMENDNKA